MYKIIKHTSKLGFVIAFSLMYTLYLYGFDSGASSGGVGLRIFLKISAVIVLLTDGLYLRIERYKLALLVFMILGLFSIIIFLPFYTSRDLQWINQFMIIPLLFWRPKMSLDEFKRLFTKIFYLWFVIDLIIFYSGRSLWINEAFVGGVGNPSSFGLFSILAIAFGLYDRKYLLLLSGIFGLILSKALMPFLAIIVSFFLIMNYRTKTVILSLMLLALINADAILGLLPMHLEFKIESLISFLGQGDYKNLASIGTRLEFFDSAMHSIGSLDTFLFGKYETNYYYSGDSQWLTYLTSFGVPLTIVFFIACIVIWHMVISKSKNKAVKVFFLALFFLFITNRILDYWPVFLIVTYLINRTHLENSYS